MKKKLCIFLFLFFPFFVFAYSKDDLFKLIEQEKICEKKETIYNEYLDKYKNLIKIKDLDESKIDEIYKNISDIIEYIKVNNICSLEDLKKINREKLKTIKKTLEMIESSKDLNTSYNNGEYIEKNTRSEFSYVGFSKNLINIKNILISSTLIIFIFLVFNKKKILDEILVIIFVLILFLDFFYYLYLKYPINFNLFDFINYKENNNIEVKDKKIISYPNFASMIGFLKTESINIPIFYGESKDIYEIGLSMIYSFPGFDGRTIISGHNSILKNIENINFNSLIRIETNYGNFDYTVYKIEVLNDDEFTKLDTNNKILIIYTCYPFNEIKYSNKRYVVYASLLKEEWFND